MPNDVSFSTRKETTDPPLLVGRERAAAMLNISTRSLAGVTAPKGTLPCVRFGRQVRYSVPELQRWISEIATKVG